MHKRQPPTPPALTVGWGTTQPQSIATKQTNNLIQCGGAMKT